MTERDYQSNLLTFQVTFASLFTLADPTGGAETALKARSRRDFDQDRSAAILYSWFMSPA
jgi:hypothetical protein